MMRLLSRSTLTDTLIPYTTLFRTEEGAADLGDGEPALARHQGQADDVGDLALVGRHAERRVALQVLDRAKAFAVGKADVGGGDVVLQVDRKSVVSGKRVSVRVDLGGRRIINKKTETRASTYSSLITQRHTQL